MNKFFEKIGIHVYALKNIPEYRNKVIARVIGFVLSIIALLDIYETVVY